MNPYRSNHKSDRTGSASVVEAVSWLIIPMIGVLVWRCLSATSDRPTLLAVDIATMTLRTHFFIAGAMDLYLGSILSGTDFFLLKWSPKDQAWVDVILYVFLFLPDGNRFSRG